MAKVAHPSKLVGLVAYRLISPGIYEQVVLECNASGALLVSDEHAATEGETRWARCMAGNVALVPGAAVAVAAVDIVAWTLGAGKKRMALQCTRDRVTGNTHLGWWIAWNCGGPVEALARLTLAMATALYAAGATVDADTNSGSLLVPPDAGPVYIPSEDDITDLYVMPLSSATPVVGSSLLQEVAA